MLSSCEMVLTDETIPQIEKKVVVFGNVLSQFGDQVISLTESKPIINNVESWGFTDVVDAQVEIKHKGIDYNFNYEENIGYVASSDIQFNSGDSLKLSILTNKKEITSSIIVPSELPSFELQVDNIKRDWETQVFVNLELLDDGQVPRYYRIETFVDYVGDTAQVDNTAQYFDNQSSKSGITKLSTSFFASNFSSGLVPNTFIILSSITKEHYDYGKALLNYNPENPFSEPIPLPNNIKGGLGVFTASQSKVIDL